MAFRQNRAQAERRRAWEHFRISHAEIFRRIGLTDPIVSTQERFLDFLMHGYIDHHGDPSRFSVHRFIDEQHALLVQFTTSFMNEFGRLSEPELVALHLARFPRTLNACRGHTSEE